MLDPKRHTLRTNPIFRVRTGCLTCRRRKKKCSEEKPVCKACSRNKIKCSWPTPTSPAPVSPNVPITDEDYVATPQPHVRQQVIDLVRISEDRNLNSSLYSTPQQEQVPGNQGEAYDSFTSFQFNTRRASCTVTTLIEPSILPGHGSDSQELLQYYLSRTANTMGNGSTELNPFVVQLLPLAFSSDLILQMLIAQSAVHRASSNQNTDDVIAEAHYAKSLRLFRQSVTNYVEGKDTNTSVLAVGALIMCFTETAKGDVVGAIFDHLSAASTLLVALFAQQNFLLPNDLRDFVIEYYIYAATLSMISIDPEHYKKNLLDPRLANMANSLVARSYVGQLCGCWLQLLLLIPRIFSFGQRVLNLQDPTQFCTPSADDFIAFSQLHDEIAQYEPSREVGYEVTLASLIYQDALSLYLLTTLNGLMLPYEGSYTKLIEHTKAKAVSLLDSLAVTARVNTSLCWPIAVIGSTISDRVFQESLRHRLIEMSHNLGLGNITQTLRLLDIAWQSTLYAKSPWTICKIMQDHQIWISFA